MKLLKENRLKKKEFSRIKTAERKKGFLVTVNFLFGSNSVPKLGITVTRKWGNAVKRNRFERISREAFRAIKDQLPKNIQINIYPKKDIIDLKTEILKKELSQLLLL